MYHRNKHRRYSGKPKKPVSPYRVVTHGSRQHVVERYRPREWGDDWEEVAMCTTREMAQQIYSRLLVRFVESLR